MLTLLLSLYFLTLRMNGFVTTKTFPSALKFALKFKVCIFYIKKVCKWYAFSISICVYCISANNTLKNCKSILGNLFSN